MSVSWSSPLPQANLNYLLHRMEDPEKVMTQAVVDMQADLAKVRQSYAEVVATQKKMEIQKAMAETVASDWMQRAELALSKVASASLRNLPHQHTCSTRPALLRRGCSALHACPSWWTRETSRWPGRRSGASSRPRRRRRRSGHSSLLRQSPSRNCACRKGKRVQLRCVSFARACASSRLHSHVSRAPLSHASHAPPLRAPLRVRHDSMAQLDSKIAEAQAVREQFVARARTAKTSVKVRSKMKWGARTVLGAMLPAWLDEPCVAMHAANPLSHTVDRTLPGERDACGRGRRARRGLAVGV